MECFFLLCLGALLTVLSLSNTQQLTTPQHEFVSPASPDNTSTLIVGQDYTISWTNRLALWFPTYAPKADVTNLDLWVTGWYIHQYNHLVSTRININQSFKLVWRVQLPADELAATSAWVFRFLQSGLFPDETSDTISSSGFTVTNLTTATTPQSSNTSSTITSAPSASSASSAAAATPIITTVYGTSSGSFAPTPTPTGSLTAPPSSSSISAKVGIAVAAVLCAAALLGLGFFLARRKSRQRAESWTQSPTVLQQHPRKKSFASPSYLQPPRSGDILNMNESTLQELECKPRVERLAELESILTS